MTANPDTSAGGRIYYRGPGIVVRRGYIETVEGRYRVRDLFIEDPYYDYAYPARMVAVGGGLAGLLLVAGLIRVFGWSELWFGVACLVVLVGVAAASVVDGRRPPRRMGLTAWYADRRVVLFRSTDWQTFEQVRRAVVRAKEAGREPRP
ncbi:DUF6232 family protein [Actinoplanes sp. NPDC023714]|uniref:DUF6232 family protein n=1 Tax=Actinoplanes sp. NPDC023714 TaxID=3154322 RepID=UPI0033D0A4EE